MRNVGNVADAINALISDLGLEKVSADVVADAGTAQPAEQEKDRSLIQKATEGSRSAENSADVKKEVPGTSVDESNPGDATNDNAVNSTENLTSATYVGEDPRVEQDYTDKAKDPGTSHPANVDRAEKYSSIKYSDDQVIKAAADVLAEAAELDNAPEDLSIKSAAEARNFLVQHTLGNTDGEKTAADASRSVDSDTAEYISGFAKSSALIGELTADMLDGMVEEMRKQAEGEIAPEELMQGAIPAEELQGGAMEEGAAVDEEAAALAQAAQEVADELGISPEEVLAMAEEELAGGGGGEEMAGGGGEEMGGVPEVEPAAGPEAGAAPEEMVVSASVKAELDELRKKAAELDRIQGEAAAAEKAASERKNMSNVLMETMDAWWANKQAEAAAK